ncbi:MAG: serine hydroxymethyltransferase [Kiritimatiellae bacterium]|nr:serine hydroxymethyltransferase [Kiritimatiellia bacterium]
MKIILASDHAGFNVKESVKNLLSSRPGVSVEDAGCDSAASCDYPVFAERAARAVETGDADFAILVCTTGAGMTIAANRFPHVRAALAIDETDAKTIRDHNGANALVISAEKTPSDKIPALVDAFLAAHSPVEERHKRRVAQLSEEGNRLVEVAHLKDADPEVYGSILAHERQERLCINLIASENLTSRAVREAQGSILTNKYAEGYPGKRWYSGCRHVDEIEALAIVRAKALFGAEAAYVLPHCGASAILAVYLAVLQPGDTILSMALDQGGHLSHGSPANISGKIYNIVPYGVDRKTERIDYDAVEALALEKRPRLILAGASAYPRTLDFARFRAIADKVGAYLLVDMAHIAGLVAGGAHPSPVPFADFVTTTTHKTLRGPRGGLILCREKYAKDVNRAVFPGLQGGPLEQVIAAKAVCFKEAMQPEYRQWAHQVVANCAAIAKDLEEDGFRLVSGGTDNHLCLVDVTAKGLTGKAAADALDETGIIVNKNTIPFDGNSPFVTSGIRIGTATVTTRGMKEPDMKFIADRIRRVLANVGDESVKAEVREEVAAFVSRFPVP